MISAAIIEWRAVETRALRMARHHGAEVRALLGAGGDARMVAATWVRREARKAAAHAASVLVAREEIAALLARENGEVQR